MSAGNTRNVTDVMLFGPKCEGNYKLDATFRELGDAGTQWNIRSLKTYWYYIYLYLTPLFVDMYPPDVHRCAFSNVVCRGSESEKQT